MAGYKTLVISGGFPPGIHVAGYLMDDEEEKAPVLGKRTRPDVVERFKRKRMIEESCVKMTLNQICLDADLIKEIDICVQGVTRVF